MKPKLQGEDSGRLSVLRHIWGPTSVQHGEFKIKEEEEEEEEEGDTLTTVKQFTLQSFMSPTLTPRTNTNYLVLEKIILIHKDKEKNRQTCTRGQISSAQLR